MLIRNGIVLTLNDDRTVYTSGAIAVRNGDIAAVGREAELAKRFVATSVIDAEGGVVHPGFIDLHTHVSIHLTRGAVPDDPAAKSLFGYGDWMNLVDDDDEYIQTQNVAIEMLRNGYTFVLEPGTVYTPDAAAAALESVGVRGSLADPYIWDVPESVGGNTMTGMIKRAPCNEERAMKLLGGQLARNQKPRSLVRGHIGLYGSNSQSEQLMRAAKEFADKDNVTFTMHHNFTLDAAKRDDVRFGGQHNLRSLAEKNLIGRRCSFVHMNVIRDDEMTTVVESEMSLVWQPGNFLFYGICRDVKSRMAELSALGVTISCSVDAAKCWTFGDLELIGYLVARMDGHFIPTTKILEMRTRDAARAASMEQEIGTLEVGKRADIVIRNSRLPETAPGLNVIQELLLGGQASTVRTVLIDGRVVYDDGNPTLVDGGDVVSRGRKAARDVLSRSGFTPRLAWPVVS